MNLQHKKVFKNENDIAIFQVLVEHLNEELHKILAANLTDKLNIELIKRRTAIFHSLFNINETKLINHLEEINVSI